jgi:hypothetical protein
MGYYLTYVVASGRSTVITVLTTMVAATYNSNTSSDFGGTSVEKDFRYCFSSMKAAAA